MPKYLIDRTVPNAGFLTPAELRDTSRTSCDVLRAMGPDVQWVHSYVTDDRITCVYIAASEDLVREHARRAGLPADRVMEIRAVIDPTTAEGRAGATAARTAAGYLRT